MGVMLVLLFAIEWLYPVVFELLPWAATPGKRALDLRVVMDTGLPVTPAASLTRNLLRAADFMPMLFAFGLLSMLLRRDFKRLGDLAAARSSSTRRAALDVALPAGEPRAPGVPLSARSRSRSCPGRPRAPADRRARRRARRARRRPAAVSRPARERRDPRDRADRRRAVAAGAAHDAAAVRSGARPGLARARIGVRCRSTKDEAEESRAAGRRGAGRRDARSRPRFAQLYRATCEHLALRAGAPIRCTDRAPRGPDGTRAPAHLSPPDFGIARLGVFSSSTFRPRCGRIGSSCWSPSWSSSSRWWWSASRPMSIPASSCRCTTPDGRCTTRCTATAATTRGRTAGTDWAMFGHYIQNNVGIAFQCFAGGLFFGIGSLVVLGYNGVLAGASPASSPGAATARISSPSSSRTGRSSSPPSCWPARPAWCWATRCSRPAGAPAAALEHAARATRRSCTASPRCSSPPPRSRRSGLRRAGSRRTSSSRVGGCCWAR